MQFVFYTYKYFKLCKTSKSIKLFCVKMHQKIPLTNFLNEAFRKKN